MKRSVLKMLTCSVLSLLLGAGLFYATSSQPTKSTTVDSIKWVDFDVTYEALEQAMELDIQTHDQKIHANWIDALAYLGAKYGGDFTNYREEDLEQFLENLKKGQGLKNFTKSMEYFPYYQKAYGMVLGGLLGYYHVEVPNQNGTGTHWVKQYGLKGFSPIAEGFWYTDCDDFGQNRSYGYSRQHLGHDLMAGTGTPVIATEGGIVEAIGWNQYGGWRLGIRSFDKNRYYYYAHLRKDHPYAENLRVGQAISPGQVIGYVGQTGYSLKENTNNIETPHLHYGMQLVLDEKAKDSPNQVWIDLYAITRLLSHHRSTVEKQGNDYVRTYQFSEENDYLASARESAKESVQLPILMYHGLLKDPAMQNDYVISPDLFESDLKYLKKNGYTTILMADLLDYVKNGTPLPEKPILITFDDGYYNNYYYGFPLLKKYDMKALISIIGIETDRFSKHKDDNPNYSNLTWNHIRKLVDSGLVEIQNHSYDAHHPKGERQGLKPAAGETHKEYVRYLEKDLMKLQKKIREATGITPSTLAYPFGAAADSTRKIVKQLGFQATLGCEEGINRIAKEDSQCLYDLKRYLRTPEKSSSDFFQQIESDMSDMD